MVAPNIPPIPDTWDKFTLAHAWTTFEAAVIPKDATPGQRAWMKDAFYSGAWILFETIKSVSKTLSEDEAEAALERLEKEVSAIRDRVVPR